MPEPRAQGGWRIVVLFLALGALLFAAYVHVTPFNERCHDLGSHLYYIGLVEKTRAIPDGKDCWECHQPPAYYALAAAVLSAAKLELPKEHAPPNEAGRGALALQALGATLGLGTLACWLMTIRLFLAGTYERVLASALATFWPTLVIQSCKVGNDALCYFFASVSFWLLVRWRVTGRAWSLVGAAASAALAMNAKASGIAAVAVVVVSMAAAVVAPPAGGRRWPAGFRRATAALGALMAAWAYVAYGVKHGHLTPNFHSMGDHLIVKNTWANFLTVHTDTFAQDPFAHAGGGFGRDEFWNYCWYEPLRRVPQRRREDEDVRVRAAAPGTELRAVLAAGLVSCVARGVRRDDAGHREMALAVLGLLGFVVALRLRYPYAPHGDFRFALPMALPCAVMAALAFARVRRRLARGWPHLAALPGWLVVAFCVASTRILLVWP